MSVSALPTDVELAWRVVKKSQSKELTLRDKFKSGLYETLVKRCEIGIEELT